MNKSHSAESTIALPKWQINDNPNRENKLTPLTLKYVECLSRIDSKVNGTKSKLKSNLSRAIIANELRSLENHEKFMLV